MKKHKKPLPHFGSDEEAARFFDEADLSDYDILGFKGALRNSKPHTPHENESATYLEIL